MGGSPAENAVITRQILDGQPGPKRDTVIMNAAAGIYLVKQNTTLEQAAQIAAEMIDSGKAKAKLEEFIAATNAVEEGE